MENLRILIIEDDFATATVLRSLFERQFDYSVTHFDNGEDALNLIFKSQGAFDVILLDYNLRGQNGMAFFHRLRNSHYHDIPVIMMTAELSRSILIEFMRTGGADFLQKPIEDLLVLETIVTHAVEISRTKKDLQRKESERLAAIEAKLFMEEFVAKLGHELGTPLHHIKSGINIALRELAKGNQEKALEWLSLVNKSNVRMTRLVNDISDLSRLQRNKLSIRKRLSNIEDIVSIATRETADKWRDFKGHLNVEVPPLALMCDPERITQVFVNLLNNAFDHARDSDRISIKVVAKNNRLVCRVEDQGQGIPEEDLEHTFAPFEQCENAYNASGTLGVGLTISRELVRLHGGEIEALPNEPRGTVFQFVLPYDQGVLQ